VNSVADAAPRDEEEAQRDRDGRAKHGDVGHRARISGDLERLLEVLSAEPGHEHRGRRDRQKRGGVGLKLRAQIEMCDGTGERDQAGARPKADREDEPSVVA
jgi:hypothetical protein